VVPQSFLLSIDISPLRRSVNCFTIVNPNPEPTIVLVFVALKNEVNKCCISVVGIPIP
jgi:hypothetical protein